MNHHEQETTITTSSIDRGADRLRPKHKLAGAAAAVTLALALAGCGTVAAEGPKEDDKSTSAPAPEQTSTPEVTETPEVPSESMEIPAGLDAETVAKLIVEERLTDWANAGANDELKDRKRELNLPWEEVVPIVVDENAQEYSVIFGDNNQSDIDNMKAANTNVLNWYIPTAWSSVDKPENEEGFRSWMTVDSVEELQDTDPNDNVRTVLVNYTNHTNADKNEGPEPERPGGQFNFTLTNDGETEDITSMTIK